VDAAAYWQDAFPPDADNSVDAGYAQATCQGVADGDYCGGDGLDGDSATLFTCGGGALQGVQLCPTTCLVNGQGDDLCE
jgi:hypothetical protein